MVPHFAVKRQNKSLGFTVEWNASSSSSTPSMDYHNPLYLRAGQPVRLQHDAFSSAGFFRAGNIADFSGNF